jgi:hypothetical protein
MYPNPASDHLTVSCDHIQGLIGIYNMLGNKVYHQTTDNKDININLEGFPAGIYSVRFSANGRIPVTKLLVIQ